MPSHEHDENIFLSHIHDEGYQEPYTTRPALADSLVTASYEGATETLDGVWHYHADQYDTALRAGWFAEPYADGSGTPIPWDFDFDQWPTMRLPATWNTRDERLFYYEESVVFARSFRFERGGERSVLLRFNAVAYAATVFLNGAYVGSHEGASTPFVVDVTDAIAEQNRIVVVVENRRRRDRVPMSNTDWFNYGGIHRSVELLRLPASYVRDFTLALVPGSGFSRISFSASVAGEDGGSVRLEVPELGIDRRIDVAGGVASCDLEAKPELWSPEHPRLYDVRVSRGDHVAVDRIGFREIRREGNEIVLNGKPIFLRGASMHEDSPTNGRTLTEAEIRENFALVKELGGNFARLAHYPHHGLASRIADEVGILLWEEIPVYWAIAFDSDETLAAASNQLAELIRRDSNRASVVIWSVGNENPDTDARLAFMRTLAERARELDGTRLVSAACLVDHVANRIADRLADHLDVIGLNEYMGWYEPDFSKLPDLFENSRPDKPVIVTEFGGGALAGHHGSRDEMFTEENQAWIYERQTRTIGSIPYIKGMSPWILYDFRSPKRANRFQRGYNRKGLLSEDKRHRKAAFFVLQEFYRSMG